MEENLKSAVEDAVSAVTGSQFKITDFNPVGGGCINKAAKVSNGQKSFFVKWNSTNRFPGMFNKEANGLQTLRETKTVTIPALISEDSSADQSFLVLEWIEPGERKNNFWENFGRNLAQLHKNTNTYFGYVEDNFIGSLPQLNNQTGNWSKFFVEYRLIPQVKLAKKDNKLQQQHLKQFETLYKNVDQLFPAELPALIHGDLWSGNFLTGADGEAVLIDPAVYFGHREAEIAFSRLFGGFNPRFYESYNEFFPLQPGWRQRTDIFNLYPLLVHLNLFGGSYLGQVEQILKKST